MYDNGYESKIDIIIFGVGNRGKRAIDMIRRCGNFVLNAVFDSDVNKQGTDVGGWIVKKPKELNDYRENILCISIYDADKRRVLETQIVDEYHFPRERIISYDELVRLVLKGKCSNYRRDKNIVFFPVTVIFESLRGFGIGGIERWTRDICEALIDETKYDLRVLSKEKNEAIDDPLNHIIDVIDVDDPFEFEVALVDYFCERIPCIFVSSQPTYALLAASVVKEVFPKMIQIVSVIHGSTEQIYMHYMSHVEWIGRIMAVSKKIKKDFIDFGVREDKIDVITCSYNSNYNLDRIYATEKCKPLRIGYAGRIEYRQKRMDLMMKFVDGLNKAGVNYYFEMAGIGEAYHDIADFINDSNVGDRVKLLGALTSDEIAGFWSRQDIAINLSDYEGHSISQMEAMAAGAIPVVTDTSGAEDDIVNGENGYIIPLEDYALAVEKIKYLNEHRYLLPIMGRASKNALIDKGSKEKQVEHMIEVFDGLISELR